MEPTSSAVKSLRRCATWRSAEVDHRRRPVAWSARTCPGRRPHGHRECRMSRRVPPRRTRSPWGDPVGRGTRRSPWPWRGRDRSRDRRCLGERTKGHAVPAAAGLSFTDSGAGVRRTARSAHRWSPLRSMISSTVTASGRGDIGEVHEAVQVSLPLEVALRRRAIVAAPSSLSFGRTSSQLVPHPDGELPLVTPFEYHVLRRVDTTVGSAMGPSRYLGLDQPVSRLASAGDLPRFAVRPREDHVVVEHLLEVGDERLGVHRVPGEPAEDGDRDASAAIDVSISVTSRDSSPPRRCPDATRRCA